MANQRKATKKTKKSSTLAPTNALEQNPSKTLYRTAKLRPSAAFFVCFFWRAVLGDKCTRPIHSSASLTEDANRFDAACKDACGSRPTAHAHFDIPGRLRFQDDLGVRDRGTMDSLLQRPRRIETACHAALVAAFLFFPPEVM